MYFALTQVDPRPSIPTHTRVDVDNGPEAGQTLITLIGRHLGQSANDVKEITIVDELCGHIHWLNSTCVQCVTAPHWGAGKGPVVVRTESGGKSVSDVSFTYNYGTFPVEQRCFPFALLFLFLSHLFALNDPFWKFQ